MWVAALSKWQARSRHIASQGLPAEVSARMSNVRAVSVLGYLAQVTDAQLAAIVEEERRAAGRIWRLPGNTLARRSPGGSEVSERRGSVSGVLRADVREHRARVEGRGTSDRGRR